MCEAFNCKRKEYAFADADYYDYAEERHSIEYPIYVMCALIVLLKYKNLHKEELKAAIDKIEEMPTPENTDIVLEDLHDKNILL